MNINQKLEAFAKTSENEARQKRKDLQDDIDRRINSALEKIKQEALESSEKALELELGRLKNAQKREIANYENAAKKRLILKRGEYLEALTLAVKSALEEYVDSHEYREWLHERICHELRENIGATIILRPTDYEYLELMGTTSSNKVTLGGYKLLHADKKRIIDNTFETRLVAYMEDFHTANA